MMSESKWTRLKRILMILVVIAMAFVLTHTNEVGRWIDVNLMPETHANLQELLQQ